VTSSPISEQGRILYVWTGTEWVPASGGGGGGLQAFYQSASPSSPELGTIWIDEDDSVAGSDAKPSYIWTGFDWVAFGDGGGGSSVLYQAEEPDAVALELEVGSLWVDSDQDLGDALATTHIHGQYLSQATASANYLRQDDASSLYLTISNASSTYLTQTNAENIYTTPQDLINAIDSLIDSAPETLDTLNELSAALNDDANFASTVTNSLGTKLNITDASATYTTQQYAETNYLKPTSASNILFTGNVTITGALDVQELSESVYRKELVSNVLTANYSDGNIFYLTNQPSVNFTINLTNAPTVDDRTFSISIITTQGSTGYYPSVFQIAGSDQTIKWSGGNTPTPTSTSGKIDIFTFTLIRTNATWFVLGSANLNF
jgi:hypothetical protein